jgi:DNA-binding GntR family transcriptional regulator
LSLHAILNELGGNRRSTRILSEVMGQLSWFCMRSAIMPDRNQMAIAEHQAILDALESRDPDAAAAAMEAHLQAVKERAIIDLEGGTR